VRDYRVTQIGKLANVQVYRDSRVNAEQIRDFGFERVVLATGARWRSDGVGRSHSDPIPGFSGANAFSASDIMDGRLPQQGPVVVFDDEHFYMGSVIAERLAAAGLSVTLVTTGDVVAGWTAHTLELIPINAQLRKMGITVVTAYDVTGFDGAAVKLAGVYGDAERTIPAKAVVAVTSRVPVEEALYGALTAAPDALQDAGIKSVTRIGDCLAPGFIAHAVYAGHRYARELDAPVDPDTVPFKRVVYAPRR
jgi:dimethylamine/trimethylamine dehydrogenase